MSRSLYWSATRSVPRMSAFDSMRVEFERLSAACRRAAPSWRSLMPYIVEAPPPSQTVVMQFNGPVLTDEQLADLKRRVERSAVTGR